VSGGLIVVEAAHTNALGHRAWGRRLRTFQPFHFAPGTTARTGFVIVTLGETGFSHEHGIDLEELVLVLQSRFRLTPPDSPAIELY